MWVFGLAAAAAAFEVNTVRYVVVTVRAQQLLADPLSVSLRHLPLILRGERPNAKTVLSD